MQHPLSLLILGLTFLPSIPAEGRTISTPQIERDYSSRLAGQPELASVIQIPADLNPEEAEALKFLYAYIPTPDALDYDTDFFLENIRISLQAAEEMTWGKRIPDREWRHFVLPVRVNNENLDHSRKVFYEELKERVKGLPMKDAILEVNHWCHEKVSYQPSDARTSSPLATVCNALGRCGEESTFTVAALRSVGIPARQVYTPRWAHTDDNHAWVEAWADGQWYFLGACEPEPVLDLAWFNDPASRGMLMTTNVAGSYDGPEEKLSVSPITTTINVTDNYAPVSQTVVNVTDANGEPVGNAEVKFMLYNYAEFYPLATKLTDTDGTATFTSGKGDMVVWATDGKLFNLSRATAGDTLGLTLDKDGSYAGVFDFDLTPPPAGGSKPSVDEDAIRDNELRKAYEDSVRMKYVDTFLTEERATAICSELGLDASAASYLVKSRGNHKVMEDFLRDTPSGLRDRAVKLLGALAEKDLHDVTPEVLEDNMLYTPGDESSPLFVPYVLNPRIELEMLRPYKEMTQKTFSPEQLALFSASPREIEEYLKEALIPDTFNPGNYRQSLRSTLDSGTANALNRSIAFVSICRSLGIPARIDPVSGLTQYADDSGVWQDVSFGTVVSDSSEPEMKSALSIDNGSDDLAREPKYYSQFTLSHIVDGKPELMEFDDFESLESINARQQPLQSGQYMLVSGQRLADGSVLARADIFTANEGEVARPTLIVRQDTTALQVIGNLDAELLYTPFDISAPSTGEPDRKSILSTTGRGYYVLGFISPGHEPSAHAINDLAAAASELEATGRKVLLLFPDRESAQRFRMEDYGKLPPNVVFGIDDGSIRDGVMKGLEMPGLSLSELPMFVVADSFNRIIFARKGYSINLGESLCRVLRDVE